MRAAPLQVLLLLRVLCLVPAGGQPKAPLRCSTECSQFTSGIAAKRIRSYRRTEPLCPKAAVILITLKSLEICADPEADWVKKIIEKLDQKKAAASPLPRAATSVAPEEPGGFQKHVGLATAPSQATPSTSFFQGTGRSPPAMEDTIQHSAGSSPVPREGAAHSEVTPEANRDSVKSPTPSTTSAAGMVSSQPVPQPMAPGQGFDNAVGSTEEPEGHTTKADVQDLSSPGSNSDSVAIPKGSDHVVLSTDKCLEPTSVRANTPDPASSSSTSHLPSILGSMESTVPATPVPPATTSVSALKSTTAVDTGPFVHISKDVSSSAVPFGTRTFDYSSPVGKQEPPDLLVFTSQAFSGQADDYRRNEQTIPEGQNNLPPPSSLSASQMHFVIPVAVVGGLMACCVAAAWLYLKFGVKTEDMSGEMVRGLLYHREGQEHNVYPMEVI